MISPPLPMRQAGLLGRYVPLCRKRKILEAHLWEAEAPLGPSAGRRVWAGHILCSPAIRRRREGERHGRR